MADPEKLQALVDAIKAKCVDKDGRMTLSCEDALTIADQFTVEAISITDICNRDGIKIVKCQLGCFH